MAVLWPERCNAIVSVSGYLIGSPEVKKTPLPPKGEFEWWYQFNFAAERGSARYEKYLRDFNQLMWQLASPEWNFDEATFNRTAASFENPDHVNIVVHNYCWRLGFGEDESRYDQYEKKLEESPAITVPAITMEGDSNSAQHPDPSEYARKFAGKYEHRPIRGGVGHNLPQETPQALAQAIVDIDGFRRK